MKGSTIRLGGKIEIQNGIKALKSIYIILNPRKWEVNIGGLIEAPHVTILFGGFFTKLSTLSYRISKKLGMSVRIKKLFDIGSLTIKTDKLTILTGYPPERVEVDYSKSDIEAEEIEINQLEI